MGFLRRVFGAVDRTYLIRAYLIGLVFFACVLLMYPQYQGPSGMSAAILTLSVVSTILFPFAKLAYDDLKRFILGKNVIFGRLDQMLIAKLLINSVLYGGAIFVAPFGILYLWFRSRNVG